MPAYAYLRRSVVSAERQGNVSFEAQRDAVMAMASARGDSDVVVLFDWGRSGRQTKGRPEYAKLLAAIKADQATAVYGYSLSRMSRSLKDYINLAELCREHGVPIRLSKEGELDYSTVTGRLMVNVLASVAQAEAEWAVERAGDTIRVRRASGQHVGAAPFGWRLQGGRLVEEPGEDVETVLAAYRSAGSFLGAARALNGAGVPSKLGQRPRDDGEAPPLWSAATVRRIVARHAPEAMPPTRSRGAKGYSGSLLYRLLRCRCGAIMTPKMEQRGDRRYPAYYCWKGSRDPRHGPPFTIAERKLLPWVMDEAARLRLPGDHVEQRAAADARRTTLEAKRERIIDLMTDGTITKADGQARLAAVDKDLAAIVTPMSIEELPTIEWETDPPDAINAVLRALWHHVELDSAMQPVRAEWRVPQWRG